MLIARAKQIDKPLFKRHTDEKCASCIALGADVATNYRAGDFVADVMQATNGAGVQIILDMVGGLYAQRNVDVLAMDGRLAAQILWLKLIRA